MLNINNVYNYYSSTLIKHSNSKLESHKPNELKDIYSRIISLNKDAPLYKLNLTDDSQNYAISIKETAIELNQVTSLLGDHSESVFNQKALASSDESKVYVSLLSSDYDKIPNPLDIDVNHLSSHQINVGSYVRSDYLSLSTKTHTFDIVTEDNTYNFKIPVTENDHNKNIQNRVIDAINSRNIGINASLDTREKTSAIVLEGTLYGRGALANDLTFSIEDTTYGNSLAYTFGLDNNLQPPTDSEFNINGTQHFSSSNNISINNTVSIDLLAPTKHTVHITTTPDFQEVSSMVDKFINSYNKLMDTALSTDANPRGGRRLSNDLTNAVKQFNDSLSHIGLNLSEDGHLSSDKDTLTKSIKSGAFQSVFEDLSDFKNSITKVTDKLTLNPLEYVDKIVITYPNFRRSFPNPYIPSRYSGLLYNRYL